MNQTEPTKTQVDFIHNIPLFESLNRSEIEVVANYVTLRELESGETLFNEWDRADYVCFIEKGSLDVLKKTGPDQQTAIARLRRGRSIGEMSIIDNFPRPATVQAGSQTKLVLFTRDSFEQLMNEHGDIGIKILKGLSRLLAQNLRKTSSRMADNMLPLG